MASAREYKIPLDNVRYYSNILVKYRRLIGSEFVANVDERRRPFRDEAMDVASLSGSDRWPVWIDP